MSSEQADILTQIRPEHLAMLRVGSAISEEVIKTRGYRSVDSPSELAELGFSPGQRRRGLLLPLHTTDGKNSVHVLRPDEPRRLPSKATGEIKTLKYELPKGCSVRLDCPSVCQPKLKDPTVTLWITEGQKKADSLASKGCCAVAVLGVWNFKGRNQLGGTTFLADWDYIAFENRDVRIVFDSDVMTKTQVRKALERLTEHLRRKGAHVTFVYLQTGANGEKLGVDDFFAQGHTLADLEALAEAPRPAPTAAPPRVELLDDSPPSIRRPLCIVGNRAYAAVWPYCKVTQTEGIDRNGRVVTFNPPLVKTAQRLLIVRDDGVIFGDGGDLPMSEVAAEVVLPEIPPNDKLWRAAAIKRYKQGYRPDPAGVFGRVVDVIDRFIDFSRSLADQHTVCEMVASYILATWFLDAFTVIGFLWPNGDRGVGKTQLLNVVCDLGYLGQLILAGGSYATLRDLADYGGCVGFDDAENLGDPKKSDPDKRALLLAGNRKGSTVSVKEQGSDKCWRTRYVNTFCPRLFSATRVPDPILASRSIVVPLVRTADVRKANADPRDYSEWPCDRRALVDDLWALSLGSLTDVGAFERNACAEARVAGRNLEPWRAILTVAKWLDESGQAGLYARIEDLAWSYQAERPELESTDLTVLTIKALRILMAREIESAVDSEFAGQTHTDSCNTCDAWNTWNTIVETAEKTTAHLLPSDIAEAVKQSLRDDESNDDWVTPDKIGRVMSKLRFRSGKESKGRRRRFSDVGTAGVCGLARAYGLCTSCTLLTSVPSAPSVTCVTETLVASGADGSWRMTI